MGLKTIEIGDAREALEIACDDRLHGRTPREAWFDCGSHECNVTLALAAGWTKRRTAGTWFCPECSQRRDGIKDNAQRQRQQSASPIPC